MKKPCPHCGYCPCCGHVPAQKVRSPYYPYWQVPMTPYPWPGTQITCQTTADPDFKTRVYN